MSSDDGTTGVATWRDPTWVAAALEWATDRLAERGVALDGKPEQPHVRAWSTAFRLPVGSGSVWLKSVGPGSDQEPALVEALGEWVPERVLVPFAVHRERRLMLLPDGGATVRAAGRASSVETWEAMVRDYAQLQLELVPRVQQMLDLGVPDLRPERLPDLAAEMLADEAFLRVDSLGGLPAEQRERLVAGLGRFREQCRRLADSGIPASVQHDDLHDANVFVTDDGYRFFDWGDANVAHPFVSLLVPLSAAARSLEVSSGDPHLLRIRDAYLEPWTAYGDARTLRQVCDLALAVGPLPRAMTWRRILRGVHPIERVEWQDAVPGWIAEYLEPGILAASAVASAG